MCAQIVICNPLDLPYRYQDMVVPGIRRVVNREGADPSLVRFRGRFYLFVSMSGGFWHSLDLASWHFVETPDLPVQDYAPDVREIDGALVFCASRRDGTCSFWRTDDPVSGDWQEFPGAFAFWDPNLFQDNDGRVYLYWGCSSTEPIRGVELDRATFLPLGGPMDLLAGDLDRHGWEWKAEADGTTVRDATAETADVRPFVEGAWMTKHAGRYYLQYAAPGTEVNTYADGYYVADRPLGPFEYGIDSPFSSVPGGFVRGAGHGSTVQDEHGNWWHVATSRISVSHAYERRIGIFPAGFDEDGVLFCNQNFADHPIRLPTGRVDPWTEVSTGWRLLSFGCPVEATSATAGHPPERVVDEDIRTWWVASARGSDERVELDLGDGCTLHAVQINLADHAIADAKPAPEIDDDGTTIRMIRTIVALDRPVSYRIDVSPDRRRWDTIFSPAVDDSDTPHRLVVLDAPTPTRYLRVRGGPGSWGAPLAISGVRAFGTRDGRPPSTPIVQTERVGDRTARIRWRTEGADGANVRYGRRGKLYHSWLVYHRDELVLPLLSAGVEYEVVVEAFNGSGVTASPPCPMQSS